MGSWGTGIYSNDTAQDLKEELKDIYGYYDDPKDSDKHIFEMYKSTVEQKWIDDDYASFWYALADWQWKHGILTEEVKNKALELLSVYAGIEDWEADASKRDVEKRKAVLNKLKEQLMSEQPPCKKPKFRVAKPKHKVGDIIIFKTYSDETDWYEHWKIHSFRAPLIFKDESIASVRYSDDVRYDNVGKYTAVLCIGSTKEPYSKNLPDVMNEHSLYVWYDYLSDVKPTVETLKNCGFSPYIDWWWKDPNKYTTGTLRWVYKFKLDGEKFARNPFITDLQKISYPDEAMRFERLFSEKERSNEYMIGWGWELNSIFKQISVERNRFDLLGRQLDNLLDPSIDNPETRPFEEVDAEVQKFLESFREDRYGITKGFTLG